MLDVVLERGFADLDAAVASGMQAPSPDGRLVGGALAYVQYGWAHRPRYRFMFAGSGFAPDAITTFARVETALRECVSAGLSGSTDSRADAFVLWVGLHGMATLEKPSRADLRRLGPLDRLALSERMVRTLAHLASG